MTVKNRLPDTESLYLFNNGEDFYSYRHMGARPDEDGVAFTVWAPNAKSVSVVGDFNGWNQKANPMKRIAKTGVWYTYIKSQNGPQVGSLYKYHICAKNGKEFDKADPYAYQAEYRPGTASVVAYMGYDWNDREWLEHRRNTQPYDLPMNIYEVHLGSFARAEDDSYLSYTDMAHKLVDYAKRMGYTHIELMPISEYPLDGSWGYQVTGYYAVTNRYGKPTEFKYFIDYCHKNGIGVILDWVPAHFPKDAFALNCFDGTPQFEYSDPRKGEHKTWGTKVFNYEKSEVRSFLLSNAVFWIDEYHVDGLRIDAVSSMLYLDYDRRPGEWVPNKEGGNINLEAKAFLQKLNSVVFEHYPNIIMAAEESTAFPMITYPVSEGGIGFNFKWNMGWMHDVLDYMSMDPYFRQFNHDKLTFSMHYAFSENYILPLSHDEVVHGKKSILDKMWGEYEEKFSQLRALMAYMFVHPGKKLNFMGADIGEFIEWRFYEELEWKLLEYEKHRKLNGFFAVLGKFYKENRCLWEIENSWDGFEWINANDNTANTISFIRKGKVEQLSAQGTLNATNELSAPSAPNEPSAPSAPNVRPYKQDKMFVVCNFGPKLRDKYIFGVPEAGSYIQILNTDDTEFGGDGCVDYSPVVAAKKEWDGREYSITFDLPPYSVVAFKKKEE